jgi:putative cobalt transporter subunit CbtA
MSARDFLIRGLLAGLLAGLAAFAVAFAVGEPSVRAAIAIEQAGAEPADQTHVHGGTGEQPSPADEVPRSLQSTAGLLTGTLVGGVTFGGLVGVLNALALGRLGRLGIRATSLTIAGIGFVAIYALPFLAYPPSPPGVGRSETIGYRTALYFLMTAISLIAAITAITVGRRMARHWGAWYAALAAVGGYLVVALAAVALMPGVNEVPAGFPATLLFNFRIASFATQLTLWGTLGVALAELGHRLVRSRQPEARALVDASA